MSISSDPAGTAGRPAERKPTKHLVGLIAGPDGTSATRIGRYSAFVGVMRYALPFVAVLLLGLVVVWPLVSGREDGFRVTYSSTQVQDDGSLKMLNANYIGTDGQGQRYTIQAEEAIPSAGDGNVIALKNLWADVAGKIVKAHEGLYNRGPETLDLAGDVTMHSDQGNELHTESAHVDIDAGTAEGDQPVSGQGPAGLIEGTGFLIAGRGESIQILGPVKMTVFPKQRVYQPGERQ